MAIPILHLWRNYFSNPDEGLGSSYERIILQNKVETICRHLRIKTILEAPSFGFTGLSGINSLGLGRLGYKVTLADHDSERLGAIEEVWQRTGVPLDTALISDYGTLPWKDRQFDLTWNFSALWFVADLPAFLAEVDRVTARAVLLMVPNRFGIGYLSQKYLGKDDLKRYLREDFIFPAQFVPVMKELGWNLVGTDFIDCPPWPDIGMPKAQFLRRIGLGRMVKDTPPEPVSVMDWHTGADPDFAAKMERYAWFERFAPWMVKRFWAHHRWFLFLR